MTMNLPLNNMLQGIDAKLKKCEIMYVSNVLRRRVLIILLKRVQK